MDEERNEVGQPLADVRARDARQDALNAENRPPLSLKERILGTVEDLVSSFLYYDRKDDDELSAEVLEAALKNGVVTLDEVVERFALELRAGIGIGE